MDQQLRNEVGDHTAGVTPVPIPNTAVKPRRADCTARETVWESRSSPALIKAQLRNQLSLFRFGNKTKPPQTTRIEARITRILGFRLESRAHTCKCELCLGVVDNNWIILREWSHTVAPKRCVGS